MAGSIIDQKYLYPRLDDAGETTSIDPVYYYQDAWAFVNRPCSSLTDITVQGLLLAAKRIGLFWKSSAALTNAHILI